MNPFSVHLKMEFKILRFVLFDVVVSIELFTGTHTCDGTEISYAFGEVFRFKRAFILSSMDTIVSTFMRNLLLTMGDGNWWFYGVNVYQFKNTYFDKKISQNHNHSFCQDKLISLLVLNL